MASSSKPRRPAAADAQRSAVDPAGWVFRSGARADWAVSRAARVERPTVALPLGTRFLGDLHLDLSDAVSLAAFEAFWDQRAAGEVWVWLGDLFEYWIGAGHERSPQGQRAMAALRRASQRGVESHLVVGNRDFLCGQGFARSTGMQVYAQGFVAQFPGAERCLVLHGDELCSQDLGYQRLRRILRAPWLSALAEVLPAWLGGALARRLRRASRQALAGKPRLVAEQSPAAAEFLLSVSGARELVTGHAHVFRQERLASGTWWVVDACGGPRDCLRRGPSGMAAEASGYPRGQ
jgi:UDP-2,3-diacylglucosamine hydrolase